MSIAEKLKQIAENTPKVYEAGRLADDKSFWDAVQEKGKRENYYYGFCGTTWTDATFKPKYDIKPTAAQYLFAYSKITNLEQILLDCGVTLDVSEATMNNSGETNKNGLASWLLGSSITHLPALKLQYLMLGSLFYNASSLVSVRAIEHKGAFFERYNDIGDFGVQGGLLFGSNSFKGCTNLEEIHEFIVDGSTEDYSYEDEYYGTVDAYYLGLIHDYIDVSNCTNLSRETLLRISNALSDYRRADILESWGEALEGYSGTCIFGATNIEKLTDEEITAILNKGWILS